MSPFRTPVAVTTGIVLLLYVAPLLLDTPLTDPDEGLHASIALEMRDHGELILPRFLGQPFLDKPILYFWTQLASMAAFGATAAAIRLPGLMFAVLGIATTGWLARTLFGTSAAWLAAAAYATLAVPFALAQAPVHDVALVPMANLAMLAFWRLGFAAERRPHDSLRYVVLAGVMLGLSALAKGLAAISIVGVAMAITTVVTRRLTVTLVLQAAVALALAAAVAAPWYLAMESRQPGYLNYYFVSRHLLGFATETQRHGGQPWWYYLPVLLAGGLPWILYAWSRAPRLKTARRDADLLLWAWVLGSLVMLSVAGSKLVTYALPAFPPIAILAARHWAAALEDPNGPALLGSRARLHAVLFAAIAAAVPWAAARTTGDGLSWPTSIAFAAATLSWAWIWMRIPVVPLAWTWRRLTIGTGATYGLALLLVAPPVAEAFSARSLAARINQSARFPARLFVVGERIGSVVFYLRPDLRQAIDPTRLRQVNAGDVAAAGAGDMIALRRELVPSLGEQGAAWERYRTAAGRYVVFGPLPPDR